MREAIEKVVGRDPREGGFMRLCDNLHMAFGKEEAVGEQDVAPEGLQDPPSDPDESRTGLEPRVRGHSTCGLVRKLRFTN